MPRLCSFPGSWDVSWKPASAGAEMLAEPHVLPATSRTPHLRPPCNRGRAHRGSILWCQFRALHPSGLQPRKGVQFDIAGIIAPRAVTHYSIDEAPMAVYPVPEYRIGAGSCGGVLQGPNRNASRATPQPADPEKWSRSCPETSSAGQRGKRPFAPSTCRDITGTRVANGLRRSRRRAHHAAPLREWKADEK